MTPIEQAKAALDLASKELDCCDWGEIDLNGEGAMGYYSHDRVKFPEGCPACKVREALTALSTMEGSVEPVAWRLYIDEVDRYLDLSQRRLQDAREACMSKDKRATRWCIDAIGAQVDAARNEAQLALSLHPSPSLSVDEVPTNEQIKDLVVECFDLGPEDIDAVLAFMCKLEDMRPEHDLRS